MLRKLVGFIWIISFLFIGNLKATATSINFHPKYLVKGSFFIKSPVITDKFGQLPNNFFYAFIPSLKFLTCNINRIYQLSSDELAIYTTSHLYKYSVTTKKLSEITTSKIKHFYNSKIMIATATLPIAVEPFIYFNSTFPIAFPLEFVTLKFPKDIVILSSETYEVGIVNNNLVIYKTLFFPPKFDGSYTFTQVSKIVGYHFNPITFEYTTFESTYEITKCISSSPVLPNFSTLSVDISKLFNWKKIERIKLIFFDKDDVINLSTIKNDLFFKIATFKKKNIRFLNSTIEVIFINSKDKFEKLISEIKSKIPITIIFPWQIQITTFDENGKRLSTQTFLLQPYSQIKLNLKGTPYIASIKIKVASILNISFWLKM